MAENLKIPASVDLEIRQAEAKAKVLADKVNASFQKIKIGGFDSSGLKAGSAALGRIRHDADQFTKSMEAANARVLAFGTAVGVIEGMRRSFLALVKTTADVEKAMTQIAVVAGDNFTKAGISIEQFGKQIFQTAKLTGQSFEITSKAALEFSRQGLGVQETLKRTRDALILSRISGVEYKTAVDGLTSTLNAFKQSGIDSTTVINKLVAVDNAAAVSLVDLIEGLQRSASVAQLTGQNLDQTIASIATLQEITARGGSQIGNSLKSIFTRLYDEDSIKFLETFQGGVIKVRDEVGNLIPAIEIMRNLGNAIKDLPKEQQLNIFKDISGLYQVNAAAALAGQGLQELNKQRAIYDKILGTSEGASDNALAANATLAEILSSKFNTLGVQLEQILNSAGKIGVKNPLSNILDSLTDIGDVIQGVLEGTDAFSKSIQAIGSFLGGSLFSPAVFGAIAIAIGKIGVNFATFAINAGKTFLGLNAAGQEQAAIQKSIAAYIQQSGANLSTLLTSESARLNLAKQISAEWAKQAVYSKQVSAVSQIVSGSVYSSGLRVGETGPTLAKGRRSAEGYLPDLVSGEMNDVKKGVGGASSNSKVVVMPNFPLGGGNKGLMVANSSESVVNLGGGKFGVLNQDMMGQRAAGGFLGGSIRGKGGQFVDKSSLESALSLMIKSAISNGATSKELNNVIQSTIKNFNLVRDSFVKVAKEANTFGQGLLKQTKQLEAAKTNANAYAQSVSNPTQLSAIPYAGLGFIGSTSAKTSSSFGSFAPSGQVLSSVSERQKQSNSIYGNVGSANTSFYGGNLNSTSDVFGVSGKEESMTIQSQALKGADPEALQKLAIKAVIVTSVLDGLSSALLRGSEETEKYADLLSKVSLSAFAFQGLNQLGGVNASNLGGGKLAEKIGGLLGGAGGGVGGALKKATGGLLAFGGGLLKFLPVVGQGALALTVLNEAIQVVTGKSGFQRLKEAFGGLTVEAEKSAQAFKDNAEFLFDASGKAILRNPKEIQGGFQSKLADARKEREAKAAGIDTDGKNKQQVSNELLGKKLDALLSGTKTGDKKTITKAGGQSSLFGKEVKIDETLGNIDSSITTVIKENLQLLSNQTEDGLREFLSSKGVSKIGSEDIKNAGFDDLQDYVYKLFLKNIVNEIGTIKLTKETGGTKEFVDVLAANFYNLPEKKTNETGSGNVFERAIAGVKKFTGSFSQESIQKFLDVQSEIELLAFDASAASIEAKIKGLESLSTSAALSSQEKNDIENSIASFQKAVLKNSLEKLKAESQVEIGKVQSNKDIEPLERVAQVEKINKQFGIQETEIRANIKSITDNTRIRQQEFNAIQKLVPAIEAAKSSLNTIALDRAKIQGNITRLQAQSNNPQLGTLQREQSQRDLAGLQIQELNNSREELLKSTRVQKLEIDSTIQDADKRKQALADLANSRDMELEAINANIDAINIETSQIGKVKDARQEFEDSLLEFSRGLGQSRAQNQMSLLQAGDKSSVVSGLIGEQSFDAVQGKTGSDLVSSLAEQNAIRQQQFDIATAASKVERLNLETELELTQQIFAIKNGDLSNGEKQLAIENAINANLEKRRSFGFGVRESVAGMRDEVNNFGNTFGKTATEGFRDGLVSAMQVAVSQTGNLKDALLDVALTFANKLRDAALTNVANMITGGGGQGGGGIVSGLLGAFTGQKYASGGKVKGGSGSKDDVPTLLMGGEYVVNKKSVQKYGPQFFEALNNGSIGQMAQGGYFAPGVRGQGTIAGKENLLDFATQTATSGGQDVRRSFSGSAGLVSLEPESLRLSSFNRFGDSPIVQATQEAKDQAFGLYVDQLGQEKQYQEQLAEYYKQLEEERAAKKKAEKEKKKQLLISLAVAAVGAGMSYGAGAGAAGKTAGNTRYNGGTIRNASERPNIPGVSTGSRSFGGSFDKKTFGGVGFSDISGPSADMSSMIRSAPQFEWREMMRQLNTQIPYGGGYNNPILPSIGRSTPYGRNSGGAISGSGDTVPIMASKGEFMINSSAAKKIGYSNLYSMNSGGVPSSGGDDSMIAAKLDELIEKTVGASNVTVNVTVAKDGEQSSQESGGDQNNKMLAEKLRSAVIQVIQTEQRPGGVLSKR